MKQQLHRSLIFWSGLLIMAFIAWAWRDSFQNTSSASYHYKLIRNADGGIAIGHYPGQAGGTRAFLVRRSDTKMVHPPWSPCPRPFFVHGSAEPEPAPDDSKLRREAFLSLHQYYLLLMYSNPASEWILFLPHWLILLLLAIHWALLLAWRSRRRNMPAIASAE